MAIHEVDKEMFMSMASKTVPNNERFNYLALAHLISLSRAKDTLHYQSSVSMVRAMRYR